MRLIKVQIEKYKSFESTQEIAIEDDITILVGMNESGKTAALEAIAKTHYFQDDKLFQFNSTHDYPRREKKKMDKSGVKPQAITCTYEIDDLLLSQIEHELGEGVFTVKEFSITTKYDNKDSWHGIIVNKKKFFENKTKELDIYSVAIIEKLIKINDVEGLIEVKKGYSDEKYVKGIALFEKYYENEWSWSDGLDEYIAREFLKPNQPKFLYYDEYYALPSRISIENLENNRLEENELKTAKALFELADINIKDIIKAE